MENFWIGALGGIIGTIVSVFFSFLIFTKQITLDNNRHFLLKLTEIIQDIYIDQLLNNKIDQNKINYLNSFQIISFDEFENIGRMVKELKEIIVHYNDGREKSISTTTTSQLEINAKENFLNKVKEIVKEIKKKT